MKIKLESDIFSPQNWMFFLKIGEGWGETGTFILVVNVSNRAHVKGTPNSIEGKLYKLLLDA